MHRDFPGLEHRESLPQSLPSGPSGILKALEVRNIAGLLSEMAPGLSNAYAGSILTGVSCPAYLSSRVASTAQTRFSSHKHNVQGRQDFATPDSIRRAWGAAFHQICRFKASVVYRRIHTLPNNVINSKTCLYLSIYANPVGEEICRLKQSSGPGKHAKDTSPINCELPPQSGTSSSITHSIFLSRILRDMDIV